jgi:Flp pilus assembly protein TadB
MERSLRLALDCIERSWELRSKKKKPSDTKSRRNFQLFFVLNIAFLIVLWFLTRCYHIPPLELALYWLFITIIMIVILWFVDRRAARMVLDDFGRNT